MSPESDAKYAAWQIREERRQEHAGEAARLRKLYAKQPKPAAVEPAPEPEPDQLSLFDYEVAPTTNGHTR